MESAAQATKRTHDGFYNQDPSGLWHYRYTKGAGTVFIAAKDAIDNHPGRAAWFWFNGTFCPILLGDTPRDIVERWNMWRSYFQKDPKSLLTLLDGLAPREPKTGN